MVQNSKIRVYIYTTKQQQHNTTLRLKKSKQQNTRKQNIMKDSKMINDTTKQYITTKKPCHITQ